MGAGDPKITSAGRTGKGQNANGTKHDGQLLSSESAV
jgi:hypothetical protein